MLITLLDIVHISVCLFLMLVVLLQQGRGGGMGAAFGGGAAAQVFGGRGAGNILTRATTVCAAIFMLTSVSLAYLSSSGDRAIKVKAMEEARKHQGDRGTPMPREAPKEPSEPMEESPPGTPPTDTVPAGTAPPAPSPSAP